MCWHGFILNQSSKHKHLLTLHAENQSSLRLLSHLLLTMNIEQTVCECDTVCVCVMGFLCLLFVCRSLVWSYEF